MNIDIEGLRKMRADGVPNADIMAHFGWTHWQFNQVLKKHNAPRGSSQSPKARKNRLSEKYGMKMGVMSHLCEALTEEQLFWAAAEASNIGCETLAEYLTELVRDAHAEATA